MAQFDLVIRGGTLIDGTGSAARDADIAIRDGVITDVGRVDGRAHRELDARGMLVTPGFVDIHTHYDAQAIWDSRLWPSSWHGVTTAVMGNCGVGFAPCRPADREQLMQLMEGVEDIPGTVLSEGLDWRWESFPQFLDALESRRHDIDFATQVPHGALRLYTMGDRGARREEATADDRAAMAQLACEAVQAGALGFSTSRTLNHRTSTGEPVPSLNASEAELTSIALGLREAGAGVLQVVSDFKDPQREMEMLRRIVKRSGRPLSVSLVQHPRKPEAFRELLALIDDASDMGLPIIAQVCGRAVGLVLGLETSLHPFSAHPAYREIAGLPLPQRIERLRDPGLRQRLALEPVAGSSLSRSLQQWHNVFVLDPVPDYEPRVERSVGAQAAAVDGSPALLALDAMLARDGHGLLYLPLLNYAEGSLDAALEMMRHPRTVLGLSDGGAHVGVICDASLPTFMLTHWTRDRTRGERLELPWVIRAQTATTARAVGLYDRGLVAPGYRADLNVIDYARLALRAPEVVADLPAGGKRLLQRADGYVATLVAGELVYERGEATGALPGRLIRGPKPAPTATPN